MPHYVYLVQWTDQGIRNVKESPKRGEDFQRAVVAAGGKVSLFLHAMGIYDVIAAVELPSDEVANRLALGAGMAGFVRTTTMKSWTDAEFRQLVEKL